MYHMAIHKGCIDFDICSNYMYIVLSHFFSSFKSFSYQRSVVFGLQNNYNCYHNQCFNFFWYLLKLKISTLFYCKKHFIKKHAFLNDVKNASGNICIKKLLVKFLNHYRDMYLERKYLNINWYIKKKKKRNVPYMYINMHSSHITFEKKFMKMYTFMNIWEWIYPTRNV